ncbi:hypothetical protein CR513_25074, partial [Mucuna pruriens]
MEIDRYFIKEKLDGSLIIIAHIPIGLQVVDVITKRLPSTRFQNLIGKRYHGSHLGYKDDQFVFFIEANVRKTRLEKIILEIGNPFQRMLMKRRRKEKAREMKILMGLEKEEVAEFAAEVEIEKEIVITDESAKEDKEFVSEPKIVGSKAIVACDIHY